MTIPPKLEPCPNCGTPPIMKPRDLSPSYVVICWKCGMNGPTDTIGIQPCADAWNRLSKPKTDLEDMRVTLQGLYDWKEDAKRDLARLSEQLRHEQQINARLREQLHGR